MTDHFNTCDVPSSSVVVTRGAITAGDFTTTNVGSTWTQATGLTFSVPAAVGDYVEFRPSFMIDPAGTSFFDVAVKVSGSFVRYASSGSGTPATEGDPGIYGDASYVGAGGGAMDLVVESGDLDAGNVVFALVYKGTGTSSIVYASTNYPLRWRAFNFGAVT
jgi:hypothetical protein